VASTGLFEDAVVIQSVPLLTIKTVYTRLGDLLPLACLLAMALVIGRSMILNRPGRARPDRVSHFPTE
jgi:apolipoprotein N-acyltransferase